MSTPARSRRLGVVLAGGIAVLAYVPLAHVPGVTLGLAYLGPTLFVFVLLWLGRYPGEKLLLVLARRTERRHGIPTFTVPRRAFTHMPRGGSLLACALAGRAPPMSRWA
jgi:hypothetical protein